MKHKTSINIFLALLAAVIIFHLLIVVKLIPYKIAWGGRLRNDADMYVFETISILMNVFLGLVLLRKGGYIKSGFKEKTVNIILWGFLVLFSLNTIGNLFARTPLEQSFAVLTFVFAILTGRILTTKHNNNFRQDRRHNKVPEEQ